MTSVSMLSVLISVYTALGAAPAFASLDNLLTNASLELVGEKSGVPRGWIVSPETGVMPSTSEESDARDGKHSLRITPNPAAHTIIAQPLHLTRADLGKKVTVWAWGQVSDSFLMYLSIRYQAQEGAPTPKMVPWPACADEWTPRKVEAIIPVDAEPESVQVVITIKPGTSGVCRIDAVRAIVEGRSAQSTAAPVVQAPAVEAPTFPEKFVELIDNGALERRDTTGRPQGWGISPEGFSVPRSANAPAPVDGQEYISLSACPQWGMLFCGIPLPPDARGKTLYLSGYARTPSPNQLYLAIRSETPQGKVELARAPWPASPSEWTRLVVRATIPADTDVSKVQALVTLRPGATGVYAVDGFHAALLP